jgi:hypothetical protein
MIHGMSHDNRGVFLIPYDGVIEKYVYENGYIVSKVQTNATNNTVQNNTSQPEQTVTVNILGEQTTVKHSILDQIKGLL